MIVHGLLIQYIWHILVKYSVNAVKHIFISQMKSSGINCSSNHNQEAQHAFLFSLRSLEPNSKIKLNLTVDFTPSNLNKRQPPAVQNTEKTDVSDFSSVLPCFSTGSQAKFHAFVSVSEHVILEISKETFQQQNKEIVKRLYNQSESFELPDTQIMEAKPRSTYCQICKETFSDYLKHLSHPVHIKKSEAQSKNTMIDDLIKGLKDEGIRLTRRRRCVADEEEMECQRMPSKVRVIQMQDTLTPMRMNSSSLSRNCYSAHKAPLN